MRVYARPDSPFWCYRFKVDGKSYRGPTKHKKEEKYRGQAEHEADAIRAKVLRGETDAEEKKLGPVADAWMKQEAARNLRSLKKNESRVRKLFGETVDPVTQKPENRFGLSRDLYVHQLSNAVLAKLKERRIAEGNKLSTIDREMSLVQSLLKYAKDTGARVPGDIKVNALKAKQKRGKLRWYTLAEEDALIRELEPARPIAYQPPPEKRSEQLRRELQDQYDIAVFFLDTGARYTEGASTPWDAVDLSKRTVNLYRDKVGNEGELAMTKRLHAMLLRRWNERAPGNPYIFPAGKGVKDGPRGYAVKGLAAAIERAGLNAAHLVARYGRATPAHTFRHTFASRLVQAGMSLQKVAYLLGHADVSTTQIYAHLVPSETAHEAAAILDRLAQRGEVVKINERRAA